MPKYLELVLCCATQLVALVLISVGFTFLPQLRHAIAAGVSENIWQVPELARLVACSSAPILLGVFSAVGMFWYVRSSSRLRQRKAAFPNQPWLLREDWEAKEVRLSNSAATAFFAIATIAYLLILLPAGIYLASLKNALLVYGFLAVVGMFLLLMMWVQWINRHRNRSFLQLETLPGEIGGSFAGLATIPLSFPKETKFHVRLRCEMTVSTAGKASDPLDLGDVPETVSRSRTETVYDDAKLVTSVEQTPSPVASTTLRVDFEIPANLPSTGKITETYGPRSRSRMSRYYCWSIRFRLSTESDLREVVFEIPVFDLKPGHHQCVEPVAQ